MRIVIVGAGEVGYSVAKNLSADGHDIVVVDNSEERAAQLENDLDVMVIHGNGARPSVLARAGVKNGCTDISLLIACTNKDEVNIMSCWIARKLGVPHVIARAVGLEFTDNESWARDLGIDMLLSPERSVAKEAEELLEVRGALHATEIAGGRAGIYVFRVAKDSLLKGLKLSEVRSKHPELVTLIVCVKRGENSFVPKASEVLEEGDICYTMCYREQVHETGLLFQPVRTKQLKRVIIIGGGKIGFQTARRLLSRSRDAKINVSIIDEDRTKCEKLARELPEALIICGDGADSALLKSEGIEAADGLVAATDSDETNLMLAVLGKTLGASKSIAIVKRTNYLGMTSYLPVDSIINRNQTLADAIIKYVRYPGSSRLLTVMEEISAEALELTLSENSPVNGVQLKDLNMPAGSIIAFIERASELLIPAGTTVLKSGDKVILFSSSEMMPMAAKCLGESAN